MTNNPRPSRNLRPHRTGTVLLAGVAAIVLSLGVAVGGSHAAPESTAQATTPTPEPLTMPATSTTPVESAEITLITGDSVIYSDSGGVMPSVAVEPHPHSGTQDVSVLIEPDGVYVIPDQVQPLIDVDAVDRRLFNVQYLAENGYTDDEIDALPVIVTYEHDRVATRTSSTDATPLSTRAEALPSTEADALELTSINGVAVQIEKDSAQEFWTHISGAGPTAIPEAMTSSRDDAGLRDGIGKVWLDGKVVATLDDSRPQIGVPEAWDLGFDGAGVTVAVLDTGYDPDHPDLAGRVAESVSFVPGQDVRDVDGHGTHVASTIAGTGEASDGRYAGVAPGADLAVGKVLAGGFGLDSWVIAGMEWAGENADVVNMSLGSMFPTDGTDPLSSALNRISDETGALFVVAAGNSGPSRSSVSAPAAADAALAVAAVDIDDQVARFSSRGPRRGDLALKPEIAAPGSPIVAAWATGTRPGPGVPVGEYYLANAGTSMASPHVAGVAAMLVQKHPEWDAQQLKDALMSTSFDAGNDGYASGAGRVDAARATTQNLHATGKADFGLVTPDEDTETQTITYTNTGDTALTVELTMDVAGQDGPPAPGVLTLSSDSVTVPAHGEATVNIMLDRAVVPFGEFTGHVRASSASAEAITAVAFAVTPPTYELTVTAKGRFGDVPHSGTVIVTDLNSAERYNASVGLDSSGTAVFEVPAGDYGIHGRVSTRDLSRPTELYSTDAFAVTAMAIDGDRVVTIDAGDAVDVEFNVVSERRVMEPTQITQNIYRTDANGTRTGLAALAARQHTDAPYGVIPADAPPLGDLYMTTLTTLREPLIRARVAGERSDLFTVTPERTGRFDGTYELDLVDVGAGTEEEFGGVDVAGKLVLAETADSYVANEAARAAEAGATALLVFPEAPGVTSVAVAFDNELPVIATTHAEGVELRKRLAEGQMSITLTGVTESSFTYTLRGAEAGAISADPVYTFDRSDLAIVENSFHSEAARRGSDSLSAFEEWEGGALAFMYFLNQPIERTDYVAAGSGIRQQHSVSSLWGGNSANLNGALTSYRPGQRVSVSWFKAPNHPSSYSELACIFCRSEAILQFAPRQYGDSDPTHYGTGRVGSTYSYYRDGEHIDRRELLLVPEAATYRIELIGQAVPDEAHYLASRSETAWTFRSEAPSELEIDGCRAVLPGANACAALPVILLGYDLPLSLGNTAPANRPFSFDVRTDRPKGYTGDAEIAGMTVSVSFDDGVSWHEAQTKPLPRGDGFRVRAHHPRLTDTNGFVSLRVEVWDDDGNRTSQTIERAYGLTG